MTIEAHCHSRRDWLDVYPPTTATLIRRAGIIPKPKKPILDIVREVSKEYGVGTLDILSDYRGIEVYRARKAAMQRAHAEGWSFVRIGVAMNRHHTTVRYACEGPRGQRLKQQQGESCKCKKGARL